MDVEGIPTSTSLVLASEESMAGRPAGELPLLSLANMADDDVKSSARFGFTPTICPR
jgi:hypothetical protein